MPDSRAQTRAEFLSTLPATPSATRLALGVVVVSILVFVSAAAFAKTPLLPVTAFLPIYQSALVICDAMTAVMLFGQFDILRQRGLLILACAYLLSSLMAVAHLLSFPGLFAQGGLLSGGPQTTAWLYFLWHAAFPLMVMIYALQGDRQRSGVVANPRRATLAGIAGVVVAVALLALLTTAGHDLFPAIMQGNRDAPMKFVVALGTWCLCIAALYLLWRRKSRSVLDLWLMVVMCVWIFDVALAAVLNGGRFDLGWYLGRVYGLLAASFVLVVLLLENNLLYSRLARTHGELSELHRELESFSYSVSHDLAAPARAVDGYGRMIEEDYADRLDDEGRRMLGVMRSEARRMGEMIRDILSFSRLGRQPMAVVEFDTGALVNDVLGGLAQEPGAAKAKINCAPLPASRGDRSLLRQVWANLIGNAIKYSSKREQPSIDIGCTDKDGLDVFFVRDNGAGFDMRSYDKLFAVFQRAHRQDEFPGTGVGLATVQRIVARHGGAVWAEGRPGEGATFYFSLPRVPGKPARRLSGPESRRGSGSQPVTVRS